MQSTGRPLREIHYFVAWILAILSGGVLGAVAGAILGAIVGVIGLAVGAPAETVRITAQVLGGLVGLAMSYLAFRLIIGRIIVRRVLAASGQGNGNGAV